MSRIGESVKQARTKKGMTVKQLAKQCGVSETYITDIESGKKVVSDALLKKLTGILGAGIDEPLYWDESEDRVDTAAPAAAIREKSIPEKKVIAPEWQSAFLNIIKDVPVYDIEMKTVVSFKHLPIIDKKVEGYNPEKLVYIVMGDNSLSGFRIKKGDWLMTLLNQEAPTSGIYYIENEGKKAVRMLKKLDGEKVLLLSNQGELKTQTKHIKEIKILGRCLKAEIDLSNVDKEA
ncbi:anaerobic benzoate catabolism transcriptional regulator [Oxobacter pfennigii]|uniref:Anaerobic benzoate catabolism transcriptional regulator n=1 Tax=Oxobacter pfennigii TaxID=36849 RepID=A0A0P8W4Z1_9CLOT|nr:helix-turn-helix transcriptional regulator [Oxobacter pfennigii]KPU43650.1 anaerobic benzoate catabolism transcriptional regulator [Oxobacter pfennigii]